MGKMLFLVIMCSSICGIFADITPVLCWTNADRSMSKQLPTLKLLETNEFEPALHSEQHQRKMVFNVNKLCTTDFKSKTAEGVLHFDELAHVSRDLTLQYYPFVREPMSLFPRNGQNTETVNVTTTNDLSKTIDPSTDIIIVDMFELSAGETESQLQRRVSRAISEILKKNHDGRTMFIVTAETSGCGQEQPQLPHSRKARDVSQQSTKVDNNPSVPIKPTILKNTNCLIALTEVMQQKGKEVTNVGNIQLNVANVTANGMRVDLTGDNDLHLNLTLVESGRSWHVVEVTINDNPATPYTSIAAPSDWSFKCSPSVIFKAKKGPVNEISIKGLQIQPKFGDGTGPLVRFGDAYDCVGFTSAGIWAGLFVTFLLLAILTVGIAWIMDIRTMDRFDDPKGKTIIVSATD